MGNLALYRKRIIPEELILLKDDVIVEQNDDVIITSWKTLRKKKDFDHGVSCYFLNDGIKMSKFYTEDNELLEWYCDIVQYEFNEDCTELIVTDLLADVVVYPDGSFKVVDLDELADAMESGLISGEQMSMCLRNLNNLLDIIYRDKFDKFQACLDGKGL